MSVREFRAIRPDFKKRNSTYDSGSGQSSKSGASNAGRAEYQTQKWGVSDAREINGLAGLGVRDAPNLEAIPNRSASF
jgi:hypothetical protein